MTTFVVISWGTSYSFSLCPASRGPLSPQFPQFNKLPVTHQPAGRPGHHCPLKGLCVSYPPRSPWHPLRFFSFSGTFCYKLTKDLSTVRKERKASGSQAWRREAGLAVGHQYCLQAALAAARWESVGRGLINFQQTFLGFDPQ